MKPKAARNQSIRNMRVEINEIKTKHNREDN